MMNEIWMLYCEFQILFMEFDLYLSDTCPEPWKQFLKSKYDAKRRNRKREGPVDFLIRRSCNSHYAEYGNITITHLCNMLQFS